MTRTAVHTPHLVQIDTARRQDVRVSTTGERGWPGSSVASLPSPQW